MPAAGRIVRTVSVVVAGVLLLAGCTSSPIGARYTVPPEPKRSAAVTRAEATTPPTPTASPTTPPPAPAADSAVPVDLKCKRLVPTSVVTAFRSTAKRDEEYEAEDGTAPGRIAAIDGTTCAWQLADSDHLIEVAIGRPSKKDLLLLKNDLVDRATSVPTFGEEAYFDNAGGTGEVNAFSGKYWIVARSPEFFEPGDAITFVKSAVTAAEDLDG